MFQWLRCQYLLFIPSHLSGDSRRPPQLLPCRLGRQGEIPAGIDVEFIFGAVPD